MFTIAWQHYLLLLETPPIGVGCVIIHILNHKYKTCLRLSGQGLMSLRAVQETLGWTCKPLTLQHQIIGAY